jgi:Skp family chaperone for outer membrane proteins
MKNIVFVFVLILSLFLSSCATVGQFKPGSTEDNIIGTVQTTFAARNAWLKKNETINMQAYIKLLEAAAQKYPGEIDVRDIVWVTGKYLGGVNVEVSATGKVVAIVINER